MLLALAKELASEGITLIDSTTYTQDQLASAGVMTQRTSRNKATKPRDAHSMLVRALEGVADVPTTLTNIRSAE